MLTVNQLYENAGMLMKRNPGYGFLRDRIETLVMEEKKYRWDTELIGAIKDKFWNDVYWKKEANPDEADNKRSAVKQK